MFQFLSQAQKNQSNPQEIFRQVTKNYNPKQMEMIFSKAKQLGVPEEIIQQIK